MIFFQIASLLIDWLFQLSAYFPLVDVLELPIHVNSSVVQVNTSLNVQHLLQASWRQYLGRSNGIHAMLKLFFEISANIASWRKKCYSYCPPRSALGLGYDQNVKLYLYEKQHGILTFSYPTDKNWCNGQNSESGSTLVNL